MLNGTTPMSAAEYTEMTQRNLSIATMVASLFSLAGGILIMYGILVQTRCCRCHAGKSRENPTITVLIMSMTISDIFQSVAFIAGAGQTLESSTSWMKSAPALCETQGFILQVFAFATPMWVLAICVTLHMIVVKTREGGFKYIMVVSLLCWGIPLLLGVIPFTFDTSAHGGWAGYGPTGAWCWIHSSNTTNSSSSAIVNIEQWALFYVELMIIFVCVVVFAGTMIAHIHKKYKNTQMWAHWKKRQGVIIRRLLLFPFAFIIAWSGGITNHVWDLFHPGQSNYDLGIFHACTVCSQGWLNAIAYGLTNQKLVKAIWEHWVLMCCRGKNAKAKATSPLSSRLTTFIDTYDEDTDEDEASAGSEMISPSRTPSASIDIGFIEDDPNSSMNRPTTVSTSSIPSGTSPYSLLGI